MTVSEHKNWILDVTREKLDALGLGYASEALDTLLSEAVSTEIVRSPVT